MFEAYKGASVLVTGGAGFIGSHLTDRLIELGAKVVVLDDLSTGKRENLSQHEGNPNFAFAHGNANDWPTLDRVFDTHKPDYVFHLGAFCGVKRVEERPLDVLKDIDGIRAIFEFCKDRKVKKILYSSSSEVYGEPISLPTHEHGPINVSPRDPYSLVKMLGENLTHHYYEQYGLKTVALRFFNVYGPRQESSPYGFVVGIFLDRALKGEPLHIFGDGSATRDFVFYKDNVNTILTAMLKDTTDGQTINVGKGIPTTIQELAERVAAVSGKDLKIEYLPVRKMEIKYRTPDVQRMHELIGTKAETTLEEGLRETYEYMKNKHGAA
ncbi:MAG: NAD-dependent epimerase/dehydratase family protein [Patescibacteria group bacterium]|nr:MAG: NAD-dependent epimerase/dehydratase family protein [Patescibacteria group bacterium]